jgi:hypothetical protein
MMSVPNTLLLSPEFGRKKWKVVLGKYE